MKRHVVGCVMVVALLFGGCEDDADPADAGANPGMDGGADFGVDLPQGTCAWAPAAIELALPQSEVEGVLRGSSRNPSTTCTRAQGAGGPEAVFVLRVPTRTVVDLALLSTMNTAIAIRRVCDDPATEVACSDVGTDLDDLPGAVDAGFVTPTSRDGGGGGTSGDAHLQTLLDPGTYFVIVDEIDASGVGGPFVLRVNSSSPPTQSSCAGALDLSNSPTLPAEQLDLARDDGFACGPSGAPRSLFYTAVIPAGKALTVHVRAVRGDRDWTPKIDVAGGCGRDQCLGSDTVSGIGDRVVRHVNVGATDQRVFLAVGATTPVIGGVFRLDATIGDALLNASCASARALVDGQIVRGQDLSAGIAHSDSHCQNSNALKLFYSVRLRPTESVHLTVTDARTGQPPLVALMWLVRDSCAATDACTLLPFPARLTNDTPASKTFVLDVSALAWPPAPFDIAVKLSMPPGQVQVTPAGGLVTSEGGGRATFDVVLNSPPAQPVLLGFASSDAQEGTVSPATMVFDATTWYQPQRVTVVGVDDGLKDGDRSYVVKVLPAASEDPRFGGVDAPDVPVVNQDDEPGLRIVAAQPLQTYESGTRATFTIALHGAPTDAVRIPIKSRDESEGVVAPAEVIFDASNWQTPQTMTVTGVEDADRDGPQPYLIDVGPAASADVGYAGVSAATLMARNADNDFDHPVAAQTINGGRACALSHNGQAVAIDDGGVISVAMECSEFGLGSQAFVAISGDGGRTFAPPRGTGLRGTNTRVIAGSVGWATVVATDETENKSAMVHTQDGGATWSQPQPVGAIVFAAAASGQRFVIGEGDNSGVTLVSSADGGRTLTRQKVVGFPMDLRIEPDGRIWTANWDATKSIGSSRDNGATFDRMIPLATTANHPAFAFGPASAFQQIDDLALAVIPLSDPTAVRRVTGLGEAFNFNRRLVPTPNDGVVSVEPKQDRIELRWLLPGAVAFGPVGSLEVAEAPSAAVALSPTAVLIVTRRKNHLWSSVELRP